MGHIISVLICGVFFCVLASLNGTSVAELMLAFSLGLLIGVIASAVVVSALKSDEPETLPKFARS